MSTCLLSVVLDLQGDIPRLYQVLCINPSLVSTANYHDGLSLPPSPPSLLSPSSSLPLSPSSTAGNLHTSLETLSLTPTQHDTNNNRGNQATTPTNDSELLRKLAYRLSLMPELTDTDSSTVARISPAVADCNADFSFEDVLEYWKSFEYLKVCIMLLSTLYMVTMVTIVSEGLHGVHCTWSVLCTWLLW